MGRAVGFSLMFVIAAHSPGWFDWLISDTGSWQFNFSCSDPNSYMDGSPQLVFPLAHIWIFEELLEEVEREIRTEITC